jgi:Fe-S-cluster-containing hydrogenase component 2
MSLSKTLSKTLSMTLSIDPSRCIGCLNCQLACASRDWDQYFPVGSKINLVFFKEGGQVPVTCFQCAEAPCRTVCLTGALQMDAQSGVIVSDPKKCVGCRACVAVCPFGNISYSEAGSRIEKCDRCQGSPRCAAACPSGAISYQPEARLPLAKREAFASSLREASLEKTSPA